MLNDVQMMVSVRLGVEASPGISRREETDKGEDGPRSPRCGISDADIEKDRMLM